MKPSELVKLIEAGFTRDDIMKLTEEDAAAPAAADPEEAKPAEDPAPAEVKKAEPAPKAEAPAAEQALSAALEKRFKSIDTQLEHLVTKLNVMAVQGSQQPAGSKQSVDDILASIVTEVKENKGGKN